MEGVEGRCPSDWRLLGDGQINLQWGNRPTGHVYKEFAESVIDFTWHIGREKRFPSASNS